MSDNEDKKHEDPISMDVGFDEESGVFVLMFKSAGKYVFQIKMNPENFEAFAADLISIVKNYNLYQAQQYQQRLEEQKNEQSGLEHTEAQAVPAEGAPQESEITKQESVQGLEEEL